MKEKNEEIESRRAFFKKAAAGVLPILALGTLGSLLSACHKETSRLSKKMKLISALE